MPAIPQVTLALLILSTDRLPQPRQLDIALPDELFNI